MRESGYDTFPVCGVFTRVGLDLSSTQWRVVVMGLVVGRIFRWIETCVSHGSLHA